MNEAFSEETELLLHQFAYGCYQNGLYEKAVRVFRLLTMFRPTDARYWYGLGSSLMSMKNDSEAIHCLKIASTCAQEDPRPRVYLAECLARSNQKEEALIVLSDVECLLDRQANSSFQEHLKMIKQKITKEEAPICQ